MKRLLPRPPRRRAKRTAGAPRRRHGDRGAADRGPARRPGGRRARRPGRAAPAELPQPRPAAPPPALPAARPRARLPRPRRPRLRPAQVQPPERRSSSAARSPRSPPSTPSCARSRRRSASGATITELREPGITACPRCGTLHGSDARFCPSCGLALSGARTIAADVGEGVHAGGRPRAAARRARPSPRRSPTDDTRRRRARGGASPRRAASPATTPATAPTSRPRSSGPEPRAPRAVSATRRPADGGTACPRCGAHVADDQDWCLQLRRRRPHAPRPDAELAPAARDRRGIVARSRCWRSRSRFVQLTRDDAPVTPTTDGRARGGHAAAGDDRAARARPRRRRRPRPARHRRDDTRRHDHDPRRHDDGPGRHGHDPRRDDATTPGATTTTPGDDHDDAVARVRPLRRERRPALDEPLRRRGRERVHRQAGIGRRRLVGPERLERRDERRRERPRGRSRPRARAPRARRAPPPGGGRCAVIAAKPSAVHAQLAERVGAVRVVAGRDEHRAPACTRGRAARRRARRASRRRRRPTPPGPAC